MDLEVVIHLRGKIRIMRRIKSLFFFWSTILRSFFNLAFYTETFCLLNGWNGNFETKIPIKMYLYKS